MSDQLETATLGAGCFWCVEAIFSSLKGVHKVVSGYAGGTTPNPTYQQVCAGTTGHAEVAQITFDPAEISYADLLYIFWRTHDPTTLNRQGNDIGEQYRSVIFYHTEAQKAVAEASMAETAASGLWPDPLVTQIAPLIAFFPAEDYHQDYFRFNPNQPYCQAVVSPKVQKFKKYFKDKLREA